MQKNEQIIIIFTGYSVNNTPKLRNLLRSLKSEGCEVSFYGIVKDLSSDLLDIETCYLYSKGSKQGLLKICYVFFLTIKLIFILSFFSKGQKIYAINPISGIVSLIVCLITNKKYIYESHEMVFGLNYPFFKGNWRFFWGCLEKRIIKNAQFFFTTDQYRLKFIRRFYKLDSRKINYILNVPPCSNANNDSNVDDLLLDFGDRFVLSYCGGIMKGRGIETIINSFSIFKSNVPDSLLVLAGMIEDDYLRSLKMIISNLDLMAEDVIFTGKLGNRLLMRYMSASNVTFALYSKDSLNNRMCSPNKIFDAIHSKTFVIATRSFLTNKVIGSNNIGVCLREITVGEILTSLNVCYSLNSENYLAVNWEGFKQKFCWESEFDRVKEFIL